MIGYSGDICLGILGWDFLLAVRPHAICIFLPTVGFLQSDFLPLCKLRVHHNMLVISGIIFRQGIGIGDFISHLLHLLICQFLCGTFRHVGSKIHTLIQLQIIRQVLFCFFLLFRRHLGKLRICVIIVVCCRQLISHAKRNPAARPCKSSHTESGIVVIICLTFLRSVPVHHRKGIQIIEVIRIQSKLDSLKPFAILIFLQNGNSLSVINTVIQGCGFISVRLFFRIHGQQSLVSLIVACFLPERNLGCPVPWRLENVLVDIIY